MAPLFSQQQRQKEDDPNQSPNNISNGSGPHQQTVPPPLPPLNGNGKINPSSIRKYLVLVHDVICIKFAPITHQSPTSAFAFKKENVGNGHNTTIIVDDEDDMVIPHRHRVSSGKHGSNSISETRNSLGNHNGSATTSLNNGDLRQTFHQGYQHNSQNQNHQRLEQLHRSDFLGHGSTTEVDHSLHALYLYKGFKEANIQCHWNAALSETFRNIQYKGYIVPSTILVGALPKFLSILRTAWSRQMLRSPAGYRIEFLGEIEEVIADPIQKGQFAPLSDSLCWAILELTSLGQEAFVDSIMSALQQAFPTMSCPSRELVFQTLEKLIRERKVYQTSRGYFVVTPDIFRYMVNANLHEFSDNPMSQAVALDALLNPGCNEDKLSFARESQSWDTHVSTGDHQNRCSSTSTGEEMIEVASSSPKLKRHNSLKMIRQRDVAVTQMSGTTHRRYSLRLPKSKSCGRMDLDEEVKPVKGKSSTIEHISRAMRSLRTATIQSSDSGGSSVVGESEKGKKNKSLFSKLFPFRRSTSKPRSSEKMIMGDNTTTPNSQTISSSSDGSMSSMKKSQENSENVGSSGAKFISTQTQTSNSTEQLCARETITLSTSSSSYTTPHPTISPENNEKSTAGPEKTKAVDSTTSSGGDGNCADIMLHHVSSYQDRNANGESSHHHNHHHHPRSSSRRSMSILDESPLYDVLHDVPSTTNIVPGNNLNLHPNFQVGCPVQHPYARGESSRCSTLSSQAASSLGYGSQGHPSITSNYSPNLDSGLASSSSYGYYGGDGSICQSHSPCASSSAGQYSANNDFPQPMKPTAYSSTRYKNSYEWYRKRYPNYISPMGRSSPLYASLTAPRSKSRTRPTYESLLTPTENLKSGNGIPQMPSEVGSKDTKGNENTTTVTQAVKSTTNMELELLLPLGKIMKAALQAKKDAIRDAWLKDELGPTYAQYASRNNGSKLNQNKQDVQPPPNINEEEEPIKVNLDNTGAKLRVGEPKIKTEVTTVVNNNGVIETHFDTNSKTRPLSEIITPMHNTVEIKTMGGVTDVVLVNGRTGRETKIMSTKDNGIYERYKKIGDIGIGKGCNDSSTSSDTVKDEGVKAC